MIKHKLVSSGLVQKKKIKGLKCTKKILILHNNNINLSIPECKNKNCAERNP